MYRTKVADIDAQFEADFASLRMKEMALSDTRTKNGVAAPAPIAAAKQGKQFRHLYEIKKDELVEFVENEDPNVLVFIHIYQLVRSVLWPSNDSPEHRNRKLLGVLIKLELTCPYVCASEPESVHSIK